MTTIAIPPLALFGMILTAAAMTGFVVWFYSILYHRRWLISLSALYHLLDQGTDICGHYNEGSGWCTFSKDEHPLPPNTYMTTDIWRNPPPVLTDHEYVPAIILYPITLIHYPVWERSGPPPPPSFPLFPDDDVLDRIKRKVR